MHVTTWCNFGCLFYVMITHEEVKNHIQSNTLKRNMLPQSTNRITKSCIQTYIKKRAEVIDATSSEGFLVLQKNYLPPRYYRVCINSDASDLWLCSTSVYHRQIHDDVEKRLTLLPSPFPLVRAGFVIVCTAALPVMRSIVGNHHPHLNITAQSPNLLSTQVALPMIPHIRRQLCAVVSGQSSLRSVSPRRTHG